MKTIIFSIAILFISFSTQAQTVSAQYEMKRIIKTPTQENPNEFITLNLTAYYYRDGAQSIFFSKPDYLKDYPNAIYNIMYSDGTGGRSFMLFSDSLQNITYANFDSLVMRYRLDITGGLSNNVMFYYSPDYRSWTIYDSVRIINGLPCKYATTKSRSGSILCEIWFYPEIEMPVTFHNTINVPGLIVEATYFNTSETFKLTHYDLDTTIPKNVFWPEYFNEPFKKIPDAIKK